jgi:hypothetical protein
MLKKEHIKQAIDAISQRDAEIGHALDELWSRGVISPSSTLASNTTDHDLHFIFDGHPARVKRVLFFDRGSAPIEERLLIKYGEMVKQHQLTTTAGELSFLEAARAVREAGLRFLVGHEIDFAIERMKTAALNGDLDPVFAVEKSARMEAIKEQRQPVTVSPEAPPKNSGIEILYAGTVDGGKPAFFTRFPFCMDALMQAADCNLEFFNIRFLLSCMERGLDKNLFACVTDNKIEGIVYLTLKQKYLYQAVEIQYISTVGGRPASDNDPGRKKLRGVGTFLTAGIWMLWKSRLTDAKALLLDSEIGARRFYEGVGFQKRGNSGFVMGAPGGRLAQAILEMAGSCPELPDHILAEINRLIKHQVNILRSRPLFQKRKQNRIHAVESIKICLRAGINPAIARRAREGLNRYRKKIPESDELLGTVNPEQ